jgi:hypothetical protein
MVEFREELKTKTVKELRLMMNGGERDLSKLAYIVTEYKLRIPYCEICGEKAPVFTKKKQADNTKKIVCVSCHRLLYDDSIMANQEFETI